jgi:hypothetical protein
MKCICSYYVADWLCAIVLTKDRHVAWKARRPLAERLAFSSGSSTSLDVSPDIVLPLPHFVRHRAPNFLALVA